MYIQRRNVAPQPTQILSGIYSPHMSKEKIHIMNQTHVHEVTSMAASARPRLQRLNHGDGRQST